MIVSRRSLAAQISSTLMMPARGLDLGLDPDARLAAGDLLDLGEQHVERLHVAGVLHLRQHELVESLARALDDFDDVAVRPLGVPRVDPDAQHAVAPVELVDRLDDLGPCRRLLERRDRVFEVEEHHVGAEAGRLGEHLLARARNRQAGTTRAANGSVLTCGPG